MTFDDLYSEGVTRNMSQNFFIDDTAAFIDITAGVLEIDMWDNDRSRWRRVVDGRKDLAGFMLLFQQARPIPEGHKAYDAFGYIEPMGDRIRSIINEICNYPQE